MLLPTLGVVCLLVAVSAQRRFYSLNNMPETNFDCRDKILGGYYADPEANCQMFHVCVKIPGQGVQDFRFLCPNETSFDQENQICADSGDIDCEAAGLYVENFDLYRIGSAPAKKPLFSSSKGTVLPLGPSTKSPLLTNNINEDDELFLQRSETGDRRLHSKDLLRGSSSSNFFNNRNNGKELDDDEDDEPVRPNNNVQPHYRPKPQQQRGKSQYSSQFRRTEAPAQSPQPQTTPSTTTTQQAFEQVEKKRTKIAVRKLARKRPAETNQQAPQTTPTPNYSSFTTQVTQKFNFGEGQRYNTINRSPSTNGPSVRPRNDQSSTLAFFEPNPTTRLPEQTPEQASSRDTTPFSLNKQPIVAAPHFQQNRPNNQNFQQNRPTTPANNQNFRPTTNGINQNQQNQQTSAPHNQNFQQTNNFRQSPPPNQSSRAPTPVNNQNQQPRQQTPPTNNQNFQQNQQPRQQVPPTNNQNFQQTNNFRQSPPPNHGNRAPAPVNNQNQQPRQQVNPPNNQNFQQSRPQTAANNQNRPPTPSNTPTYQQTRPSTPLINQTPQRPTTLPPNNRAQTINNGLEGRSTVSAGTPRQYYDRNVDDFEDNDQQEFLKTAPSNNFRPSDLNSFQNSYKNQNFDESSTKFSQTSTTKYYTPTIITTPKTFPTRSSNDFQTTLNQFYSSNPHSPSTKSFNTPSSTLQPPTSGPQPRPFSTTPNQQPTPSTAAKSKDASYDYAYYDDAGSFSEYDALDALGESDFSRTSQRQKSRLI